MKIIKKIVLISLLLTVSWTSFAFDIPQYDSYVTDNADILSDQEEQNLEAQISNLEKETTAEIWVLTIKTTEWEDISQISFDVWNKWWVWKKDNSNWIMIVIASEDRNWFIASWYWVEWTLPDAILKRIWESDFPPNFREWNYYQWIYEAVSDISWYLKNDPSIVSKYSSSNNSDYWEGWEIWTAWSMLSFVIAVILALFTIFSAKKKIKKDKKIWWFQKFLIALVVFFVALWITLIFAVAFFAFFVALMILFWKAWWWGWSSSWWWWSSWGWFSSWWSSFWWGSFWWGWSGGKW